MPEVLIFKEMIEDFGVPFIAYKELGKGGWDDSGDPIPVGVPIPANMVGVILPLTEDDLRYAENGTYSVKDRKLYTTQALEMGQKIEYKGIRYTVQNFKEYTDYTDVFIYYARWAGNGNSGT